MGKKKVPLINVPRRGNASSKKLETTRSKKKGGREGKGKEERGEERLSGSLSERNSWKEGRAQLRRKKKGLRIKN